MTINFLDEILQPYNEQYETDYQTIGELLAHLKYEKKVTWEKTEKILGVDRTCLYKHFKKSKYFRPNFRKTELLKPKIEALDKKKLATMDIHEIMAEIPGYTESAYYNILRIGHHKYNKRGKWKT